MLAKLRQVLSCQLTIAELVVSYLGSIVSWPVLLFSNVSMT